MNAPSDLWTLSAFVTDLTRDPDRWMAAGITMAAWGTLSLVTAIGPKLLARRTRPAAEPESWLVAHASQTGQAEQQAIRTAEALRRAGYPVTVLPLGQLDLDTLKTTSRLLIVAATTGDGEPPDAARPFVRKVMRESPDLSGLGYAVLGLGDRHYSAFCAFAQEVDTWLSDGGAKPLWPRVSVDKLAEVDLAQWAAHLKSVGAKTRAPIDQTPPFSPWTLTARERLNPLSRAAAIAHLTLRPTKALPDWQAGDLAEIETPSGAVRTYSLASLPDSGQVELVVRLATDAKGQPGQGSGLLHLGLELGQTVPLRIRAHAGFHTPPGYAPLLLVGAGSGLAGLRAHVLARAARGDRRNWLVFGERHPEADRLLQADFETWQQDGTLERLDLVHSRPPEGGTGQYVQDRLQEVAEDLSAFLGSDGQVLVCGGLPMGQGVDAALRAILGEAWVEAAIEDGRYRRDLY